MAITEIKSQGIYKEYNLTLDMNPIEQQIEEELEKIRATRNIEGFRPGKVPMSIIKPKYYQEVKRRLVVTEAEKAIEEFTSDISILGKVNISDIDFEANPLVINFSFTIMPEIQELDYESLELEKLVCDISPKEIENNLNILKNQLRNFQDSDEPAQLEDKVIIDFLGKINGKAFDGGQGDNVPLILGSKQFIEGFEEGLIGIKAGEKRDLALTFPKNYHSAQAGKDAIFSVTVHKVQKPEALPSNEQVAERFGKADIGEVEDLIRNHLQEQLDQMSKVFLRKTLFDKLDALYDIELPENLVAQEKEAIHTQADHTHDENCNHEAEYGPLATRRVKLGLILSELGKRAAIEITSQDIKDAVYSQANAFPGREHEVIQFFRSNEAARDSLRGPIMEDKVVDFILDRVKFVERHISLEELQELYNSIR